MAVHQEQCVEALHLQHETPTASNLVLQSLILAKYTLIESLFFLMLFSSLFKPRILLDLDIEV